MAHTSYKGWAPRSTATMSTWGCHAAMLRTLESRHDEMTQAASAPDGEIPSADELAAEVEEFLRDQKPEE